MGLFGGTPWLLSLEGAVGWSGAGRRAVGAVLGGGSRACWFGDFGGCQQSLFACCSSDERLL